VTSRRQWAVVGASVLVSTVGLVAATRFFAEELRPVTLGVAAPVFRARTLGEQPDERTLDDYRGQVVLLNIWATWCRPCRVEMPSIEELHRAYGSAGLKVVAVSVDAPGNEGAIRQFAREIGLSFEILHDPSGDIQRVYQTLGMPETFLIGRDGVIRKKVLGATRWDSGANRALVAQLLAEQET
jgi:cytochrome c biogenesis protein CcmG/thiol:disulfide interchange protein DsbE